MPQGVDPQDRAAASTKTMKAETPVRIAVLYDHPMALEMLASDAGDVITDRDRKLAASMDKMVG